MPRRFSSRPAQGTMLSGEAELLDSFVVVEPGRHRVRKLPPAQGP